MTTMESLPKQYESLESMLFLFGEDRFPKLAMKHRGEFAQGKPFPHVVIDDFLPHEAAMRLYLNYPKVDENIIHHDNENTSRKLQPDVSFMHPYMRAFSVATGRVVHAPVHEGIFSGSRFSRVHPLSRDRYRNRMSPRRSISLWWWRDD